MDIPGQQVLSIDLIVCPSSRRFLQTSIHWVDKAQPYFKNKNLSWKRNIENQRVIAILTLQHHYINITVTDIYMSLLVSLRCYWLCVCEEGKDVDVGKWRPVCDLRSVVVDCGRDERAERNVKDERWEMQKTIWCVFLFFSRGIQTKKNPAYNF